MKAYQFTYDWFSNAIPVWKKHVLPNLVKNPAVLELGAFEGRATVWIAEHLQPNYQVAVDTWHGSGEHGGIDMDMVYRRFDANVEDLPVERYIGTTFRALTEDGGVDNAFDLIYVDASHVALDVLTDAILAWPKLNPNGIIVFDDYAWPGGVDEFDRPKLGITSFLRTLRPETFRPLYSGYQLIIQKIK